MNAPRKRCVKNAKSKDDEPVVEISVHFAGGAPKGVPTKVTFKMGDFEKIGKLADALEERGRKESKPDGRLRCPNCGEPINIASGWHATCHNCGHHWSLAEARKNEEGVHRIL